MLPSRSSFRKPIAVVEVLCAEHEQIRTLFVTYAAMMKPHTRRILATRTFEALERHVRLEQHIFYPALAAVTGREGRREIALRLQEHRQVTALLQEVRALDAAAPGFDAAFHMLIEHMDPLIDAEENIIFLLANKQLATRDENLLRAIEEFRT